VYLVGASSFVLPRKIVAAVEVSDKESPDNELNERIIQQATSLAMQCGADLHLLFACDISAGYLADMDGLALADLTRELRKDLEKTSSGWRASTGWPPIIDTSSWVTPSRH
jgi:universal stress protein E